MALLGVFHHDDYLPEFGTLVVRDGARDRSAGSDDLSGSPGGPGADGVPLAEYATKAQPCGTIARAGYGWLEAAAGDVCREVRLEHHDSAPSIDTTAWDDIVETPFGSGTGGIGLTFVTGGPASADLVIGAGLHRVRVSRKGGENDEDSWLLQFWPDADPEPPRWFMRERPALSPGITGWSELLGYEASEVLGVVRAVTGDDGATVEKVQEWAVAHGRSAGWLDEPLFPAPPEPLPSGHADLDAAAWQRREGVLAEHGRRLAELAGFAGQLGVPGPVTRRGLLDLFVAAGVLMLDESGRCRLASRQPRAWDVLDLPEKQVESLEHYDATTRYRSFASDLVSTVSWSRSGGEYGTATLTVPELAERLLATPDDVRATLRYAVSEGLLAVDGATVRVLPKQAAPVPSATYVQPPPPGPPWHTQESPTMSTLLGIMVKAGDELSEEVLQEFRKALPSRPQRYRPPVGAPPRAGIVTGGGDVVVWRDGESVVLAHQPVGSRPNMALESAHGIVLLGFTAMSALIRPDGGVEPLGVDVATGKLSEDGGKLAVIEVHHDRRESSFALHLIDLVDNSRETMPWDGQRPIGSVIAVHGATVYFTNDRATVAWTPGTEPEPVGRGLRSIDPLSGVSLLVEDTRGVIVRGPDGTRHRVVIDQGAALAPGGDALYSFRHAPPAVTLFDLEKLEAPQVFWLPNGSHFGFGGPVWEDANTLVVRVGGSWSIELGATAVRLDIRTGEFEAVPFGGRDHGALIVTPLLRTDR